MDYGLQFFHVFGYGVGLAISNVFGYGFLSNLTHKWIWKWISFQPHPQPYPNLYKSAPTTFTGVSHDAMFCRMMVASCMLQFEKCHLLPIQK